MWTRFSETFSDRNNCFTFVEAVYLKTDMCKFDTSQIHETESILLGHSKICSKCRAFNSSKLTELKLNTDTKVGDIVKPLYTQHEKLAIWLYDNTEKDHNLSFKYFDQYQTCLIKIAITIFFTKTYSTQGMGLNQSAIILTRRLCRGYLPEHRYVLVWINANQRKQSPAVWFLKSIAAIPELFFVFHKAILHHTKSASNQYITNEFKLPFEKMSLGE